MSLLRTTFSPFLRNDLARWIAAVLPALLLSACAAPPRGIDHHWDRPPREDAGDRSTSTPPSPGPSTTAPSPSPQTPRAPQMPETGGLIVDTALGYLGTPYRYGGDRPAGFDCSGLVMRVYAEHGIALPRTCAEQSRRGMRISREEAHPGDLVFFGDSEARPSHVGIYMGSGRFIHASTNRGGVRIDSLGDGYFRTRYRQTRRLIGSTRAAAG